VVRARIALGLTLAIAAAPFVASATVFNLTSTIDPFQETGCGINPATNPSRGQGAMTFDDATGNLTWNITFGTNAPAFDNGLLSAGATENGAHFHGPALPGQTAGVKIGLALGSPKVGAQVIAAATDRADLMAGKWYINIHSAQCLGGEIRGQVLAVSSGPALQGWGVWALGALILGAALFAARGELHT
jgi:hypothetical protein